MLLLCLLFNPFKAYSQCTTLGTGYTVSIDNSNPLPFCDIITFTATITNTCNEDLDGVVVSLGLPIGAEAILFGFEDDFPNSNSSVYSTDPFPLATGSTVTKTFLMRHINCSPLSGTTSIIFNSITDNNVLAQNGPNGTYFPKPCHEVNGSFQDILDDPTTPNSLIPDQDLSCDDLHRTYYIPDELIIDVNGQYCINSTLNTPTTGNIHFSPNASIVIKNGAHLILRDVEIFGCEEMWESIIVEDGGELTLHNCNIQDGINAIRAEDGAILNIRDCNFTDNWTGILVPSNPGVVQNVTFNNFFNNYFSGGDTGLKAPYLNKKPLAGIAVYDLSVLSVPYFTSANIAFGSTFENMEYGIRAFRSHLVVDRAKFIDIQPQAGPLQVGGYGIRSIGNPSLCIIRGFGNDPFDDAMFYNCNVGISSSKNAFILEDILMKGVKRGIVTGQNNFLFNFILDNRIEASDIGIDLFGQSPATGIIEGNEFKMDHPSGSAFSYGIRSNGFPFSSPNGWEIENNFFHLLKARNGISLTSGSNTQIRNNTIFMDDPVLEDYYGIYLFGSPNTTIECNVIEGNAEISTANYKNAYGISNDGSTNCGIGCNDIDKTHVGINFWGMCSFTNLYGNILDHHHSGLQIGAENDGNAFIGAQLLKGNQWPGLNSTDDTNNDGLVGARHFGDAGMIIQSEFKVEATGNINIQYMPSIETPSSNSNSWFEDLIGNNSNYACNSIPTFCGGYTGLVGTSDDKLKENIATNQLATDGFDTSLQYTGARQLYRNLDANPSQISPGSVYESFMTAESTTTVGQFHNIQVSTEALFELDATERSTLSQNNADITFSISEILKRDSLIATSSDPAQITIWKNEKSTLLSTLGNQTTNANNQFDQLLNTIQADAALVESSNNAISTTLLHETNEQTLNAIYLSSFAIEVEPDSLQLVALEAIANQCPLEGGTVVYRARALVQGSGYDDYALCDRARARKDKSENTSMETFNLFPNPTSGIITLRFTSDVQSISISNTLGQTIHTWNNSEMLDTWTMPDLGLSNGLYFCTVESVNTQQTKSFLVIR